jgi:bacillithiol biosynthesis deacetylase BshB1
MCATEATREVESSTADVLAIAAHRDDVEQTCGGTLLRMASRGLRTAILDLTQGEAGTRGTAEDRAREADEAARILGVGWRQALDMPDGAIENTLENRIKIVRVLRQVRPRVVILPYWQARHPDHAIVATLGYEACFLSGLAPAVRPTAPSARQWQRPGKQKRRRIGLSRLSMPASMPTCGPASLWTSRPSSSSGTRR